MILQLVKKFPAFLEPEGSSPYSQVPATCPYPEPTPSSPHNPLPLPEDPLSPYIIVIKYENRVLCNTVYGEVRSQ